jgi:hypothetical protein
VEYRHRYALLRIHQSDRSLADDGLPPDVFNLIHRGGMRRQIDHPRWDPSWPVPDEHTIDDLGELDILRIQPRVNKARTFELTMKGRHEAAAVAEQLIAPTVAGGRAPAAFDVLQWLLRVSDDEPACFDMPPRLLDRAVTDHLIDSAGREPLARRILGLVEEGYLRGDLPDVDQATAEQTISMTQNLHLSVRAAQMEDSVVHETPSTVFAPIINSQIAGGDITNYVTFVDVLDRAYEEVEALDDVDEEIKDEAKHLIDQLRGKAAVASSQVVTGAGGALLAEVLARLLGLIHG